MMYAMTNQKSVNQFLTEKFFGKCCAKRVAAAPPEPLVNKKGKPFLWSYSRLSDYTLKRFRSDLEYHCPKCNTWMPSDNQDLFTPDGFFLLWNKAQEQEWWDEFIKRYGYIDRFESEPVCIQIDTIHINPQTFPILLAEYLGWKEGE